KADLIAKQTNIAGVKGMVLDVEVEWENTGSGGDAVALCDGIRSKLDAGKMLGFSSFGWIAYHLGFPWKQFDGHCGDMHLPQTYYDEWTTGRLGGYQKALDGAQQLNLKAPIWAAQDNYNGATVDQMNTFFDAAGPYSNLWRWPDPNDTGLVNELPKLHWKN